MSWKLAELKWRQELGIYESRWERESGPLPLERKHAVEVFERRNMVSPGRRTSPTPKCRPKISPGRHSTRLGTAAPPASPSVTLPALHPSRDLVASHEPKNFHSRSPGSLETILDAFATRYNPSIETELLHLRPSVTRSQSCPPLPHKQSPWLPSFSSSISIPAPPTRQTEDSEHFSSWLPAFNNHTPQLTTACEEFTRLLDHIDSASQAGSPGYEESFLPTLESTRPESCSHLQEASSLPLSASPSQREQATRPGDRPSAKDTSFRLLGSGRPIRNSQISTATDTSETNWPTTLSRHNSSSNLLPNTNMSRGITDPGENGTPASNEGSETQPQPYSQEPVQPVRRTTPIYQDYGQAYTSITGGITGAGFDSQPGTDSLNNVYSRAMNEDAATSTRSFGAQDNATAGIGGPVQFPFQQNASPENNDHMHNQHVGDNPAGMHIEPTDVALQPILRTVPRSSVTYATSLPREPSSLVFQEAHRVVRNRSTSVPMRSPTPYPGRSNNDDSLDSSVGAIVDQYGNNNEDSAIDENSSIAGTSAGGFRVHPRQRRTLTTAGPPPAWPLPVEPSTLPRDLSDSIAHSSSPPTYGATTELLDRRHRPASALREQILRLPQRAMARNSSLYSSELDEIIARRGNSSTPFDEIGDPGPAVDSSLRSLSPAPEVVPRSRVHEPGTVVEDDQRHAQDDNVEPSSSSAIGVALTSMDDPVVRGEANTNVTGVLRARADIDDDAAWETTQGSNTQRNSAVPEVDNAAFSSTESLGRQATSTWDPLAANLRGLAEAEREFAHLQLVQAQETSLLGVPQSETPEHSMHIASLSGIAHAGPSTPVASPEQTFTTITSRPRNNNRYQQSLPGTSLFTRTPRTNILQSDTIVNMSSETASDHERTARIAAVEEEIRRYEPRSSEEGPRRFFPEARLTTDRRVLDAENDEAFVHRQHLLARSLLMASIATYPIGGFLLVNSMASNGPVARSAILSLSLSGGGPPINNVHPVDMALAERAELVVLFCVAAAMVAVVAVLVAFLRGALV